MSLRHLNALSLFLAAGIVSLIAAGCNQDPVPQGQPASAAVTPDKSFEEIVRLLKDGLEFPGGKANLFVSPSPGVSSRFQVENTVTSDLIPPAAADDAYRGVITVATQSVYSMRKTGEAKDDEKKDNDKQPEAGASLLDESAESGPGFSSFDESLIKESPDASDPGEDEVDSVQRRADRVERKFDLVYKKNRWELSTKPDPETEASIKNAFDRALQMQP